MLVDCSLFTNVNDKWHVKTWWATRRIGWKGGSYWTELRKSVDQRGPGRGEMREEGEGRRRRWKWRRRWRWWWRCEQKRTWPRAMTTASDWFYIFSPLFILPASWLFPPRPAPLALAFFFGCWCCCAVGCCCCHKFTQTALFYSSDGSSSVKRATRKQIKTYTAVSTIMISKTDTRTQTARVSQF